MNQISSYQKLTQEALENLNERSRSILEKRFGLFGKKKETLEKIGKDFGITRERIRQIIADSFRKLGKKEKGGEMEDFSQKIVFTLEKRGGIISQEELLSSLAGENPRERNAFLFLLKCLGEIREIEFQGFIRSSWCLSEFSLDKIRETEKEALVILREEKKILSLEWLAERIEKKSQSENIKAFEAKNYLRVLDKVRSNKFGKWGLAEWPEITPKNTRDKIYLTLKENKKPLHFREIARRIDESGLSQKKAHPQTVHNELIKDKRFVLIGRGIYAISEWGYSEGTVRDILKKILGESGPLSKDEIFEKVFKQRKVKKATVMINLNNPRFFERRGDIYELKK